MKRAILAALPFVGVKAWHTPAGRRSSGKAHLAPAGTPDIIGYRLRDGRMVAIEVKAGRGEPSDVQTEWLGNALRCGVICGVAWGVADAVAIVQAAK